jgi:hypothetical protein
MAKKQAGKKKFDTSFGFGANARKPMKPKAPKTPNESSRKGGGS